MCSCPLPPVPIRVLPSQNYSATKGSRRGAGRCRQRLGAYVVNKAITFPKRLRLAGDLDNPKQAKDVLYLRDLMAAGREVQNEIRTDLRKLAAGRAERFDLNAALNNIDGMLRGALQPIIAEVAEALAQRDDLESVEAARADVEGHLTDLREDIADIIG